MYNFGDVVIIIVCVYLLYCFSLGRSSNHRGRRENTERVDGDGAGAKRDFSQHPLGYVVCVLQARTYFFINQN